MPVPLLATKLYIPPLRQKMVLRPRLVERLNKGICGKLTLISAPAGFGKTTLTSEWIATCERPAAWLSLDEGDSDPTRFLTYLIAALRTILPEVGESLLTVLQSPQPPPTDYILTTLLNEIAAAPHNFILALDDYHTIDSSPGRSSKSVDQILTYLIENQPPSMHLVIATRENPALPLARYRATGQLTELRLADLRFTPTEAAQFLNQVMELDLSPQDINALENRTEGWIAGLQLASLALQGLVHHDPRQMETDSTHEPGERNEFIKSFTGSHHFVLDYLLEEVLNQQPESIQAFLLRTSILDRMCGPLCEAVCDGGAVLQDRPVSGQETLEYLENANLFIVPLDNERRWYRYHRLFCDLLKQRLLHTKDLHLQRPQQVISATSTGTEEPGIATYHIRASAWYAGNGLFIEAFQHAAAANDIDRAEQLIRDLPLHLRNVVILVLDWIAALPDSVKDARPALWVRSGTLSLIIGHTTGVEEKLQSAESALQGAEMDQTTLSLFGQIATARATLALTRYQPGEMISQSLRALEYLPPENLAFRASANWTLGYGYEMLGERAAAEKALVEAIKISQTSGDVFTTLLATIGLGQVQEMANQLHQAEEIYQRVKQMMGDQPLQIVNEAYLGMGRIYYERNKLELAEENGQQSLRLARMYESGIDRFIICEVFLARVKLAGGDIEGAAHLLEQADRYARQHDFVHRIPEVAAARVPILIRQGELGSAEQLAQSLDLPVSQTRVHLARGDPSAALALLDPIRQQLETKGWQDELLRVLVLQALAHYALSHQEPGELEGALQVLGEALRMAEPGGFIRLFVDEGAPMRDLLSEAGMQGIMQGYVSRLLQAFESEPQTALGDQRSRSGADRSDPLAVQSLAEPLSLRELEVLRLVAQGLSNREISERLFLALDTVKGHNRRIYAKLGVQRRTEAVRRSRELGLL